MRLPDSLHRECHQLYKNINYTRSGISIDVYSVLTLLALLFKGKLNRQVFCAYKIIQSFNTRYRYLTLEFRIYPMASNFFFICRQLTSNLVNGQSPLPCQLFRVKSMQCNFTCTSHTITKSDREFLFTKCLP